MLRCGAAAGLCLFIYGMPAPIGSHPHGSIILRVLLIKPSGNFDRRIRIANNNVRYRTLGHKWDVDEGCQTANRREEGREGHNPAVTHEIAANVGIGRSR